MAEVDTIIERAIGQMSQFEELVLDEATSLRSYLSDGLDAFARAEGRQRFSTSGPYGERYRIEIMVMESTAVALELLHFLVHERGEKAEARGFWSLTDAERQARSQLALLSLTRNCAHLVSALAEGIARGHKVPAFALFRTFTEFSDLAIAVLADSGFHSDYLDWIHHPENSVTHWRRVGPAVAQRTVETALREMGLQVELVSELRGVHRFNYQAASAFLHGNLRMISGTHNSAGYGPVDDPIPDEDLTLLAGWGALQSFLLTGIVFKLLRATHGWVGDRNNEFERDYLIFTKFIECLYLASREAPEEEMKEDEERAS